MHTDAWGTGFVRGCVTSMMARTVRLGDFVIQVRPDGECHSIWASLPSRPDDQWPYTSGLDAVADILKYHHKAEPPFSLYDSLTPEERAFVYARGRSAVDVTSRLIALYHQWYTDRGG